MAPRPLDAISDEVERILPHKTIRKKQLSNLADSLNYIHSHHPFMWLTHVLRNRIRLLVGRLIVLTLKDDHVWLATDATAESGHLSNLASWEWDTGGCPDGYPEYKRPPSRNGYYHPSKDRDRDWQHIRRLHFDYLDRLMVKKRAFDPRSVAKHEPNLATYISEAIGCSVADSKSVQLPQEVTSPAQYWEGSIKRISVNRYERDPAAREACLRRFGYRCAACGMSFGEWYGKEVEWLIHVHHVVPLSEIREGYSPDPEHDLVPICPNCHAVIHTLGPSTTVEDIREMLRRSATDRGVTHRG